MLHVFSLVVDTCVFRAVPGRGVTSGLDRRIAAMSGAGLSIKYV